FQSYLSGVSCSSPVACTAVGTRNGQTLAVRWDGHRWRVESTPTPALNAGLRAVSCPTPRACVAVGSSSNGGSTASLAEHWNGLRWSVQPTKQHRADITVLSGVACRTGRDCTATVWYGSDSPNLGPQSTLSEHWNGRTWSEQATPNP